jgi:hypothetical protein
MFLIPIRRQAHKANPLPLRILCNEP